MSALSRRKRTFITTTVTSVRGQKPTLAAAPAMSARGQLLTHAPQQKRGPIGHTVGVTLWLLWVADRARCWSRPTAEAEICQTLSTIPNFRGRHETEYPRPSRRN